MDTIVTMDPTPRGLIERIGRDVRTRLFDSHVEDIWSALSHYRMDTLGADALVEVLASEVGCLRSLAPAADAGHLACTVGALALLEGLTAEAGSAEAVTEEAIDAAIDRLLERLRDDLVEDIVDPESDCGTEAANTNSNSRDPGSKPEIRNYEFEERDPEGRSS